MKITKLGIRTAPVHTPIDDAEHFLFGVTVEGENGVLHVMRSFPRSVLEPYFKEAYEQYEKRRTVVINDEIERDNNGNF